MAVTLTTNIFRTQISSGPLACGYYRTKCNHQILLFLPLSAPKTPTSSIKGPLGIPGEWISPASTNNSNHCLINCHVVSAISSASTFRTHSLRWALWHQPGTTVPLWSSSAIFYQASRCLVEAEALESRDVRSAWCCVDKWGRRLLMPYYLF